MANETPNIPTLSSKVDVEVQRAFNAVKNWFTQISSSGGVVTQGTLAAGLAVLPALTPFLDGTIPPQLATFTATGAFRTIMLTWDDPRYSSFAFVEVWRATVNDLGVAVRIGTTQSTMYTDLPANSSLSVTYYYWARVISKGSVIGPFNATAGTPASTANDPAYMLQVLTNQLSATQLAVSLSSRIDLIDIPGTGLVASVDSLSTSILNSIPDTATWLNQLIREKAISDATVDINATTGIISLKALTANILPDDLVRINSLEFDLNAANGSILGHTNTLSAQGATLISQDTRITQAEGNIGLKASTAYVDGKTQEVANLLGPDAAAMFGDDVPSSLFWLLFAAKDAKDEARQNTANMAVAQIDIKSNVDAVSANAAIIATTQTALNGNIATVQTQQTSINGINAQYTVKLDVNGKVAGVGLMNDGATSAMIVNVDKFAIAGAGAADVYPFIVVGGVVYIKAASIQDATITNAKIQNLATDKLTVGSVLIASALIGDLDVGKLTGTAITGKTIQTAVSGERFVVDVASKAAHFYDAAGVEKIWMGTASSAQGFDAWNSFCVYGKLNDAKTGGVGLTSSSYGWVGAAATGIGLYGTSNSGYGGIFGHITKDISGNQWIGAGNLKGAIVIGPSLDTTAPVHAALGGTLWVTYSGVLYVNITSPILGEGTTWQKVSLQ